MKNKFLILFLGIISFLGISEVKANTYTFDYSYSGTSASSSFINDKSILFQDKQIIKKMYDDLYDYYDENYRSLYPYYYLTLSSFYSNMSNHKYRLSLVYFSSNSLYLSYDDPDNLDYISGHLYDSNHNRLTTSDFSRIDYTYENSAYVTPFSEYNNSFSYLGDLLSHNGTYEVMERYLYSNIPITFYSNDSSDKLVINNYAFSGESNTINVGDNIPLLQEDMELDIISDPNLPSSGYTEINLNNYPYIVLSLKDYTITNEYYTNMYVKGEYCVTPVYNYGLTTYDTANNTRVQNICSQYYNEETMIRMYITSDNLKNHAIYYIKAQDTSKENKIKVDTSIFNIHYITQEDEDNPIININGKNYSVIPFDELPSTANNNTDEDFIPGQSCQVGDFNCSRSNYFRSDSNLFDENGDLSFSNLFSSPLDLLKDIWSAIIKVFELISMLVLLLPAPLQSFLFLSFMLAIILGIIKILL